MESIDEAEYHLAEAARSLTEPKDRECLPCYVYRMVTAFNCDGSLRWARLWRDTQAPRATALLRRLADQGGFCDCEVLMNIHPDVLPDDPSDAVSPCAGVSRRGSSRPCRNARF